MSRTGLAVALVALCFLALSRFASAEPFAHSIYAAYDAREFYSEPVSDSLAGAKIGWQARKAAGQVAGFLEVGYLGAASEDFYLLSLGGGGKFPAYTHGPLELGGLLLFEVQHAHVQRHRNTNVLVAFGGGAYGDVRLSARAWLTLTLSFHAFVDVTPPTRCNDGSSSQSTGQGTCSWHGGIDFYTDQLGNGAGLDALLGFRYALGDVAKRHAAGTK